MTQPINPREQEMLSAFLDNALKPRERQQLESQLQTRPELRAALNELRQTQQLLRQAPTLRAPRNFTLTPEMAGLRTRPPRVYPAFQWAFALASFLFVLVLAGELFSRTPTGANPVAMAPAAESVVVQEEAPMEAVDTAPEEMQDELQNTSEGETEESGAGNAEMAPPPEQTPGPLDSYTRIEEPTPTAEATFKSQQEDGAAEQSIPAADEPMTATLLGPEPAVAGGTDMDATNPAPEPSPDFWASPWRIPQLLLAIVVIASGLGLFIFRRKTML